MLNKDTSLGIIHPESALAHKYLDGLKGIEIGAASYQPFGLNSLNVSTSDLLDRARFDGIQRMVCGSVVPVDIYAEADEIPVEDHSQDFIVASHVIEHTSNPIKVFLEWKRILKVGGYIFMIFPKRESPYGDQKRHITPLDDYISAYLGNWNNTMAYDFMSDRPSKEFDVMRGHIWVFDLWHMLKLIQWCNGEIDLNMDRLKWKLIEAHETDDTDGTGHMVLLQQC